MNFVILLTSGTLAPAGAVLKSLCLVSISHNKKAGNIIINKQGSDTLWKFDLCGKVWIVKNKSKLKDKELEYFGYMLRV
jgi:hypothetical protein